MLMRPNLLLSKYFSSEAIVRKISNQGSQHPRRKFTWPNWVKKSAKNTVFNIIFSIVVQALLAIINLNG